MLVVNAFLTLSTGLPFNLYIAILENHIEEFWNKYTLRQLFTMDTVLIGVLLTNAFTTPIVYYIFNRHFRVCTPL